MAKKLPDCPGCGSNKQVTAIGLEGSFFNCGRCNATFDCDPSEGGDFFTDPTKRIELADERAARQRAKVGGRRSFRTGR